jgi:hypothetical protein
MAACIVAALCTILVSCEKDDEGTSGNIVFDVRCIAEFQNTLYPSMIFGMTEMEKQMGELIDYFTISVATDKTTDIRIGIEESKVNSETVITEKNVKGEREFVPAVKWKWDDLKTLSQPGNVDMTFVCYDGKGNELGRKDMRLSYRSINECVLAMVIDDEAIPMYFLVASYINEDSPVIDAFLKDVLKEFPQLSGFTGYQSGEDGVIQQVAAVFLTMRQMGVKYSSITATSNSNPNIISQYIRFSDEVLNNTQANCADGTAFFCSVLQKIGISTVMIFAPGHVYLGYYGSPEKTAESLYMLETTAVGSANFGFVEATNYQVDNFIEHLDEYANDDWFDGYIFIDVEGARQIIKPIGRSISRPVNLLPEIKEGGSIGKKIPE